VTGTILLKLIVRLSAVLVNVMVLRDGKQIGGFQSE
jgi:hypothetical protein